MTATQTATKAPEKPTMAAKKPFTLPDFQAVDEVPVPVRAATTARLPIGLDEMYAAATKSKKPQMRFIPNELWESRGIEAAKIVPTANKDRLRRAFYSWAGKDAAKLKYTLAFSDQADKNGKPTGVNMYFTLKAA